MRTLRPSRGEASGPRDLKGRRISHLRLGARNVIKTIRRGANASAERAVRAALPIGRVSLRLFREATQLKTEGAMIDALVVEPIYTEIQVK